MRFPELRRKWPNKPNVFLYRPSFELDCETENVILFPETDLLAMIFRWNGVAVTFSCNKRDDAKESESPEYS